MTYPKTSCPCGSCPPAPYFLAPSRGPSSSLAISNCQASKGFECSQHQVYKMDEQPKPFQNKCNPLNKLGIKLQAYNYTTFPSECGTAFLGNNPLLVNTPTGTPILLDRPNFTGELSCHGVPPFDRLYSNKMNDYGKGYTDLSSINAGQIQYYTMSDTSDAYFKPNFVTPAVVTHEIFKDPMGVYRPQYNRQSLQDYSYKQSCPDECDSATHDSLEFRQELMEKQMRKANQQRWDARWASEVAQQH